MAERSFPLTTIYTSALRRFIRYRSLMDRELESKGTVQRLYGVLLGLGLAAVAGDDEDISKTMADLVGDQVDWDIAVEYNAMLKQGLEVLREQLTGPGPAGTTVDEDKAQRHPAGS